MRWTQEECILLKNDWDYWLKNKEEAVRVFKRPMSSISVKGSSIGCKSNNILKSNKNILDLCKNNIYGLLLSDASLVSTNKSTGYLQQDCIHKEWLEKTQQYLCDYNIGSKINNGRINSGYPSDNLIYKMWTKCYIEFKELKEKWYPEGKKIVPGDIKLTPECVANWYLGDGFIDNRYKKHEYMLGLTCDAFNRNETKLLSEMLNSVIYINSSVKNSRNIISVHNKHDVISFLDYIKNFWIPCYNYKFSIDLIYGVEK